MELLAPAGSFQALCAAVQSGADAVYIGGNSFSARRSAVNFSLEEIKEAVNYCHLRGVKIHVAANILIKENEVNDFLQYIGDLNDIGVDAIIIQDIGMASLVRKMYPDLPLHASTQMTVASAKAAQRLKEIGFSRIVLARELSKEAIAEIVRKVDIEIEVFAHGAICMSYSGQCLMSSIIGGRSGNRGMCAQPCRLPYKIEDKSGHLLSPKDLCMVKRLDELRKIGVTSLKIEGRLKRSEYVAAVVGIYRKYIDNPEKVTLDDMKVLLDAFSRSGFTDGYFDGKLGKNMMCYDNPANSAENLFSADVKKRCREDANFKKKEIYMSASMKKDMPLSVSIWDDDGNFAQGEGEYLAEIAQNKAMEKEHLESQLLKMGNTPFCVKNIEIEVEEGITMPVSEINNVRRIVTELFVQKICEAPSRKKNQFLYKNTSVGYDLPPILVAEVSNYEQAKVCIESGICEIYADTHLANRLYKEFKNTHIIAKLPPVFREDRKYEKPLTDSILISNIGQFDDEKKCYGDFRLNIFNGASVEFYEKLERLTISPELNLKEISQICDGCEVVGYGRLPLMVMENCPLKALSKCQDKKMKYSLTDRMKEKFPIKCNEGCTCELLNSKPVFMADKREFVNKLKISAIRLIFTVENSAECGKIIEEYKMAILGKVAHTPQENTFTRGHFFRGVE